MAKLLRVRDRILLGLTLMADILDDVRLVGGALPAAYEGMYGFIPEKYKRENLYATVNRMIKADIIEKIVERGEAKFRLTSTGKKRFIREFPLLTLQDQHWDKKWRVLVFDIPEGVRWRRDRFRQKLKELGFGMMQESVWISPHAFEDDVREYIAMNKFEAFVYLFVTNEIFAGNPKNLAEKVWKLEELNSSYQDMVDEYKNREVEKRELVEAYMHILFIDPFLPRELLPDPWYGDQARLLMRKIAIKSY